MAKTKLVCPRCGDPVRWGRVQADDSPIDGSVQSDTTTIELYPCGCVAAKDDADFQQFVDVLKKCLGIP